MLGEPSANSSGDRKDEILIDSWPQVRTTQTHLHPTCQGCEKKRKKILCFGMYNQEMNI